MRTLPPRPPKSAVYGLAAIAAPFVSVGAALAYQALTHREFWRRDPPGSAAGAMMAGAEVIEWVMAATVGCLLGSALAILSLRSRARGLGRAALAVNTAGAVLLAVLWLRLLTGSL
jgi:hypothetical protein